MFIHTLTHSYIRILDKKLVLKILKSVYCILHKCILSGFPKTIMADKGTEWNALVPHLTLIQMKSTFNQVCSQASLFTKYQHL